jgi:hypothetical protein
MTWQHVTWQHVVEGPFVPLSALRQLDRVRNGLSSSPIPDPNREGGFLSNQLRLTDSEETSAVLVCEPRDGVPRYLDLDARPTGRIYQRLEACFGVRLGDVV